MPQANRCVSKSGENSSTSISKKTNGPKETRDHCNLVTIPINMRNQEIHTTQTKILRGLQFPVHVILAQLQKTNIPKVQQRILFSFSRAYGNKRMKKIIMKITKSTLTLYFLHKTSCITYYPNLWTWIFFKISCT